MSAIERGEVYGELEACDTCGHLKTEYVDHGYYGKFRCWWCTDRAGGTSPKHRYGHAPNTQA